MQTFLGYVGPKKYFRDEDFTWTETECEKQPWDLKGRSTCPHLPSSFPFSGFTFEDAMLNQIYG